MTFNEVIKITPKCYEEKTKRNHWLRSLGKGRYWYGLFLTFITYINWMMWIRNLKQRDNARTDSQFFIFQCRAYNVDSVHSFSNLRLNYQKKKNVLIQSMDSYWDYCSIITSCSKVLPGPQAPLTTSQAPKAWHEPMEVIFSIPLTSSNLE